MTVVERRRGQAFLASLSMHCGVAALALIVMRPHPAGPRLRIDHTLAPPPLVWLSADGPGGGGGGGGNRRQDPAGRPTLSGRDQRTVPATAPRRMDTSTPDPIDPDRIPRVVIPVVPQALGDVELPGSMTAPPGPSTASQGPGADGGAGTGKGPGDGPGSGAGFGPGSQRGTGGDFYRPGGDVTMPIEIRKGTPQYTTDAMRARAQGAITVKCVVQTNGVCAGIRVLRSFSPSFGLDQEAIKAAAQWRFRPGMHRGQPVPVLVTMEIEFAVR
jgi:protein TonB